MRKKGFVVIVLLCSGLFSFDTAPTQHVFFGVSLSVSGVNSDLTFALVTKNDGQQPAYRHISKTDFIKMVAGEWLSPANPKRINLFDTNKIVGGIYFDSTTFEKIPYCPALDSLWKLRYNYNPYQPNENGWAGEKYKPSAKQATYLFDNYGIYNISSDFFIDSNCWKILRDVCNPDWIVHYKSLK
jgi:hypothetical protein